MNNKNGLLKPKSGLSDKQEVSAVLMHPTAIFKFPDRILPAPVTGKNFILTGPATIRSPFHPAVGNNRP